MNLKMLLRAALFAALTAIGAFIRIPIGQMSVTLQALFSLTAGLVLKEKWGAISQIIYVALGIIGLPVFTGGGGLQYVLQPSFGFIIGLVMLSFIAGRFVKNNFSIINCSLGCGLAIAALYAIGLPYMYIVMNYYLNTAVSAGYVVIWGMLVYLPFDLLKIATAITVSIKLESALKF